MKSVSAGRNDASPNKIRTQKWRNRMSEQPGEVCSRNSQRGARNVQLDGENSEAMQTIFQFSNAEISAQTTSVLRLVLPIVPVRRDYLDSILP